MATAYVHFLDQTPTRSFRTHEFFTHFSLDYSHHIKSSVLYRTYGRKDMECLIHRLTFTTYSPSRLLTSTVHREVGKLRSFFKASFLHESNAGCTHS